MEKPLLPYCCQSPGNRTGGYSFLQVLQVKKRADERTRTAYPCSLRVIHRALQRFARSCKSRINRRLSLLGVAACCTVLRSRWHQIGINIILMSA